MTVPSFIIFIIVSINIESYHLSIVEENESGVAFDVMGLAGGMDGAVNLDNLDNLAIGVRGCKLVPCWGHSLAVSTPVRVLMCVREWAEGVRGQKTNTDTRTETETVRVTVPWSVELDKSEPLGNGGGEVVIRGYIKCQ